MVIDFELMAWLMRNLSERCKSKKHSLARRDLIEINIAWIVAAGAGRARQLQFRNRDQCFKGSEFSQRRKMWRMRMRSCAVGPLASLCGVLGAGGKRSEHILAGNNAHQSMVTVDHGNAPDSVLDHELQYSRQFGIGSDVNVL
jgi:hypothetical protein